MGLARLNIPVIMMESAGKKKTQVRKGKDRGREGGTRPP